MCPHCGGNLCLDSLETAPLACLLCARRFDTDLTPTARPPSAEERSRQSRIRDTVTEAWATRLAAR